MKKLQKRAYYTALGKWTEDFEYELAYLINPFLISRKIEETREGLSVMYLTNTPNIQINVSILTLRIDFNQIACELMRKY